MHEQLTAELLFENETYIYYIYDLFDQSICPFYSHLLPLLANLYPTFLPFAQGLGFRSGIDRKSRILIHDFFSIGS